MMRVMWGSGGLRVYYYIKSAQDGWKKDPDAVLVISVLDLWMVVFANEMKEYSLDPLEDLLVLILS